MALRALMALNSMTGIISYFYSLVYRLDYKMHRWDRNDKFYWICPLIGKPPTGMAITMGTAPQRLC